MQRVLSTVVLTGLLFATAAAFAVTEHLKLVKAPLHGAQVPKYLSPGCGCASAKAAIVFKLRHAGVATVRIVDARRDTIATLAAGEPESKGEHRFVWNGRTDTGSRAPDGRYEAEIKLTHWGIVLPNPIDLDTRPPLVRKLSAGPLVVSPGSAGPADHLRLRYELSERAHLILWHGATRLLRTRVSRASDKTTWDGRTARVPWKAGRYTLTVGAVDLAGNVTPPAQRKQLVVTIRYVALGRRRVSVEAGKRFAVHVDAFGPYTWTFHHRHGTSRKPLLRLRAPAKSGRYRLRVTEAGHTASALVVAR